jgi:two-component system, cell cycle response regulator CpdR
MARIVVADDESDIRSLIARALGQDGHVVRAAADGAAALDMLAREPADLVLSDIKMPVMDGIALALSAARDFPTVRIVLMTGYADQRERAHGLDSLVDSVLAKPFSLDELRQAVAAALARGR